ncbi:MAG TPA: DUF2905 domain-containing protein [Candidatus Binataceae bacterium]|nr:DUF2905 domain-containing protein [Candidatus Binataceae bacterium]
MAAVAKILIAAGLAVTAVGIILWSLSYLPGIGRLPGDIYVKRGNFVFYFPIMTSIILSIVLTIVLSLLRR